MTSFAALLSAFVDALNRSGDRDRFWYAAGVMNAADPAQTWTIQPAPDRITLVEGTHDAELLVILAPDALRELVALLDGSAEPTAARVTAALMPITVVPGGMQLAVAHLFAGLLGVTIDDATFDARGVIELPLRYPSGENVFRARQYAAAPLPDYAPDALPALVADEHPQWIALYRQAWTIAFRNLRQPEPESGLVANFIDTAFNDNTFMWDSCFMTLFGSYGQRVFPFIQTLDNFYAKQHADGYICREINTYDGRDIFRPHNPSSTGPNILAWTEWLHFEQHRDHARLQAIFPVLVAYHRWWRDWRTWPDGSYFTTGWGSGMDNQTRVPDSMFHHRHYAWVDASLQQALSCQMLQRIGTTIGREDFNAELQAEFDHLQRIINRRLWSDADAFYLDRAPDGSFSPVKSIGAYWGLLSDAVPPDRAAQLIAHLDDPALFNRPHRVPTQAADSPGYQPDGAYWRGGVWAPTNYMLLRGLSRHGQHDLAYAIARNHLDNVTQVFEETGTVWENYAPEYAGHGRPAKPDFVGWTGLSAITIPIEYVIGLQPDVAANTLTWHIRLTGRHGVQRYPFGAEGTLDLISEPRRHENAPPVLTVRTNVDVTLAVEWPSGEAVRVLEPGTHRLQL